jgi:hypothetical protein
MLQLLDKYGPEPGFEQALRSLDPNTVATKLIGEKVVPNNPEEIRAMVEYVHKDGARGLITGRMQGIQALHDAAVQWEKGCARRASRSGTGRDPGAHRRSRFPAHQSQPADAEGVGGQPLSPSSQAASSAARFPSVSCFAASSSFTSAAFAKL